MVGTKTTRKRWQLPLFVAGFHPVFGPFGCDRTRVWDLTDSVTYGPDVPAWRDRLRRGENATSELEGFRTKRTIRYGTASSVYLNGMHFRFTGVLFGHDLVAEPFNSPSLETTADNDAAREFAENYRKATRQFQSGVFMGELMQTVRGIVRPGKALRESVGDLSKDMLDLLRKGKGHRSTKEFLNDTAKAAADTWLEWQFGIKPTLSDLDDASRALRQLAQGRGFDVIRIRGEGKSEGLVSVEPLAWSIPSSCAAPTEAQFIRDKVDRTSVRYIMGWKNSNPSGDMPVLQSFGLTLSDFVPTVWELIPYSWLVDYFSNMGSVLDAWSIRHVHFAWGCRTVRNSRTVRVHSPSCPLTSYNAGNIITNSIAGGQSSVVTTSVRRNSVDKAPVPSFQLEVPGIGSLKWLNLAALGAARRENHRLADLLR